MNPEEIIEKFKSKFGSGILDARTETHTGGTSKMPYHFVWLHIPPALLKDAVQFMAGEYPYPHLSVVSGADAGKCIELTYHFTVGYGVRGGEIPVSIRVELSKENPVIPTITGIIPGALITEREKQEMLGIRVEGIPDARRLFVPETFPEGVYPWRKDEKGLKPEHIKKLWEVGRPKACGQTNGECPVVSSSKCDNCSRINIDGELKSQSLKSGQGAVLNIQKAESGSGKSELPTSETRHPKLKGGVQ